VLAEAWHIAPTKLPRSCSNNIPSASAISTIAEVRTEEGKLYLFVAIDRTSKVAFASGGRSIAATISRADPAALEPSADAGLGGALAHDAFASAASSAARSRMFGAGCLFFAALPRFIGRADQFVNLRLTVSSGATGTASTSSFGSRLRTALMAARRPPMIRMPRGRADSRH
jgi:hypothetical protein